MSGHATSSLFRLRFFFSLSLSLGSLWFLLLSLRRQRQAAKTVKKLFIVFIVLITVKLVLGKSLILRILPDPNPT
jgi:hypothetical protein